MKKAVLSMVLVLTVAFPVIGCAQKPASSTNLEHQQKAAETAQAEEPEEHTGDVVNIQILGTSDTHGKFVPYDYALNEESMTGSMAQIATAVKELRNENTLVIDAGDVIQDN